MNIDATLIIQIIAFALLVFFINKVLWGPLSNIMHERQKRIEDGLAAASRGQAKQQEAQVEAENLLTQSKAQAREIIANAQKQANSMIEESKTLAVQEAEKIKHQAQADIDQEVSRTKKVLHDQVSDLVVAGVRAVLEKEIDAKKHQDMLRRLAATL